MIEPDSTEREDPRFQADPVLIFSDGRANSWAETIYQHCSDCRRSRHDVRACPSARWCNAANDFCSLR